ncbi:hypothetical protein DXG01_011421 [Tephrocybe rancida]|nr:hypothetical protein DXG01_011421 [Tephrocybe rancida]
MGTSIIDDQDLSKVTYNGTRWIVGGSPEENNETVASSTNVGDFFTVSFRGTNIAVFGTFDSTSGGVETTYSIDGSAPVTATSQAGTTDTFRQQFWRSGPLAIGDHKLVVNMTKVNSDPTANEGTVWFDYFLVTDPTISSTAPGAPIVSQPAKEGATNAHTGAIIGAVFGGLFFLLGVVFLCLFYRRKTRVNNIHNKMEEAVLTNHHRETSVQPFRLTLADTLPNGEPTVSGAIDTERPNANAGTLISGAPAMASRKSVASMRPGTGHSTQASIGNSSTTAFVVDEPLPSSSEARNTLNDRDKRRRALRVNVDTVSSPAVTTTVATSSSQGPDLEPDPVQHVDSGLRASSVGVPESLALKENWSF